MWLVIERDTVTHEIHSVKPAHPGNGEVLSTTGVKPTGGKRKSQPGEAS
jgi:sarcosine oxidase delta subunit